MRTWERANGSNVQFSSIASFLALICIIVLFTLSSTSQILTYRMSFWKVSVDLLSYREKTAICEANFHGFTGLEGSSFALRKLWNNFNWTKLMDCHIWETLQHNCLSLWYLHSSLIVFSSVLLQSSILVVIHAAVVCFTISQGPSI